MENEIILEENEQLDTDISGYVRPQIVDLSDYVKNTDYATNAIGGVVKTGSYFNLDKNGVAICDTMGVSSYLSDRTGSFISKGTLENIKEDYIKRALISDSMSFTDEEIEIVKKKLGIS
jgi:hypothetical protein